MEDSHIEKTVARLVRFRDLYSEKVQVLDNTIAVIRALPAEEAALSLVAELPAAAARPVILDQPVTPRTKKPGGRKGSKYPGVVEVRSVNLGVRYKARPRIDKKNLYLGTFATAKAAAAAIEDYKTKMTKAVPASVPKNKAEKGRAKADRKKPKSQYFGVRTIGNRFEGQVWDKKEKKLKYLGSFNTELEAAVAVAKARGDSDEVRRLSDMLEQMENNPDRPDSRLGPSGRRTYPVTVEPDIVYRCKHCRIEYQSKPTSCIHCNSASFEEIKNEGKS